MGHQWNMALVLGAALLLMAGCTGAPGNVAPITVPTSQTQPTVVQTSAPPSSLDIMSATGWSERTVLAAGENSNLLSVVDSGTGNIAVASLDSQDPFVRSVAGIDASTGEVIWGPERMSQLGGTDEGDIVLCGAGGTVVVSQNNGSAGVSYLLDATNGKVTQQWSFEGDIDDSCNIAGGYMVQFYYLSNVIRYQVRAVGYPGQVIWQKDVSASAVMGDSLDYAVRIIGGTLVRTYNPDTDSFDLYNVSTGQLALSYPHGNSMVGPDGDHVLRDNYSDSTVDETTRWDIVNNQPAWPNTVPGGWPGVSITSDVVVVISPDGTMLTGVRMSDGTQLWQVPVPADQVAWGFGDTATQKWSFIRDGDTDITYAVANATGTVAQRSWKGEVLFGGSRVVFATDRANDMLLGLDGASDDLASLWEVPLPTPSLGEDWIMYTAVGGNVLAYTFAGEVWALKH